LCESKTPLRTETTLPRDAFCQSLFSALRSLHVVDLEFSDRCSSIRRRSYSPLEESPPLSLGSLARFLGDDSCAFTDPPYASTLLNADFPPGSKLLLHADVPLLSSSKYIPPLQPRPFLTLLRYALRIVRPPLRPGSCFLSFYAKHVSLLLHSPSDRRDIFSEDVLSEISFPSRQPARTIASSPTYTREGVAVYTPTPLTTSSSFRAARFDPDVELACFPLPSSLQRLLFRPARR